MNNVEFQPHELKAFETLDQISPECTLFLRRENDDFPLNIEDTKEIGLYGNGVRRTLKGGTGSGDVEIHVFQNIEQVFKAKNIKITSENWLDSYDFLHKQKNAEFIKRVKKEAKAIGAQAPAFSVGYNMEEPEYDFSDKFGNSEVNIYVLSRQAGECRDKRPIKGDYYLTDTEIRDILFLQNHSKKFLLVINSASLVDISPINEKVDNILLLSFLGCRTSETLFNLVFGISYPSGKLAQTWDRLENCPAKDFGDINDTYYKEGIFTGYRYYASKDIKPLYPFGFGLSYTDFKIEFVSIINVKCEFLLKAHVKNIGNHLGKEVVQLYLSKPSTDGLLNPKIELVGFSKTRELSPNEVGDISIVFKLSDFACFDINKDAYVLPKGIYLLSLGNCSTSLNPVASIELEEDIIITKVKHIDENLNVKEDNYHTQFSYDKQSTNIKLTIHDFAFNEIQYHDFEIQNNPLIEKLVDDDLIKLSIGNISKGLMGAIGFSCESVIGGAGETTLNVPSIKKSLTFADGPAGIRISMECIHAFGKNRKVSMDPLWMLIFQYLPKSASFVLDSRKNRFLPGKKYYQYTTSLPVATSIACSFSIDVAKKIGEIVQREMNLFGVDIWLAPAMNIIRHPLCGRNFEYYSEDPLLTSEIASSITKSVQSDSKCGVCIKHFACNNQETNRFQSNSNISVRALREIYLRGFERVIKNAHPSTVMTSYNLINGEHVSQSTLFIKDILRSEFDFKGLIISDWISTGTIGDINSIYPTINAYKELNAGLNIVMPGNKKDILDIKEALAKGHITRDDLIKNCSFVYEKIISKKEK